MDVEREGVRERELERQPAYPDEGLPLGAERRREDARRLKEGKVVIHKTDREKEQRVQALNRYYTAIEKTDTVPNGWKCFTNEVHVHSGRHTHQGGLVLFIVKGRGYSIVDGVKRDWKAGDLLLLPVQRGGSEHQHFNADDSEPAIWCAFIYTPFFDALNTEIKQSSEHAGWKGKREVIPDVNEHGFD